MRAVALLVLLVLASPLAGGWTQLRGGPERPGQLLLADETLDVVATGELLEGDERLGLFLAPGLVQTPHGHATLARRPDDGACTLLLVRDWDAPARVAVPSCRYGWLQGYDQASDALILCSRASAQGAVLQAVDPASGALRWGLAPAHLGVVGTDAALAWGCSGMAIDEANGLVLGPLHESRAGFDYTRHRIVAVEAATGRVRWATQVAPHSAVRGDLALPLAPDGSGANFLPFSATITSSGVV
ncbi:MAG TPA: hypothetical protein VM582_03295, partial [Candidatus Thermoplasmatota archaeon]|nr:hypothetical protein [Candidatus Thermoplasmatota archaeon]